MDQSNQSLSLSRKEQVRGMFNSIAGKYDFLNHFLSLGIDHSWRKKLVQEARKTNPQFILDVATGTADVALSMVSLQPQQIVGVDISEKMLDIGVQKIEKKGLSHLIHLQVADSESLPFVDKRFDLVTVAFGVRNFENLEKGLNELHRVTQDNGSLIILEFSMPARFPIKQLYLFYFKQILPTLGRLISGNKNAYTYLPSSVQAFPYGESFRMLLLKSGFETVSFYPLSFGIATLYISRK